jgi:hypothetical protein
MWYPPQYHPGVPPYMYPEPPYHQWPAPRAPPARPPRRAIYTEEPRDADVEESAEVAVARGFGALVQDMLREMGRGLARFPVDMRIVPFAALTRNAVETAAVRGSAPSASPFTLEVPVSVETALTGQIKLVEWMQTQCATNVHHAHHAAFNAALSMVRAAARYTRLVYRQTGGTESLYDDPELQPLSDRASALAAYEHLRTYLEKEAGSSRADKGDYTTAHRQLLHKDIEVLVKKWANAP